MTLRNGVLLMLIFLAVGAADARATFRIHNHLDPAGDPTKIGYRIDGPWKDGTPYDFELVDGDYRSTGPPPGGTWVASALLPPGWVVHDIQCIGPREGGGVSDFVIDVPNGRVTLLRHDATDEHICSFTNRKLSEPPSSPAGVSPTPRGPGEAAKVVLPRRPALIGVRAGRGYAEGTVRITRKSVIKARLQRGASRIFGKARVVLEPGTHDVRVRLDRKRKKRMRRRGLEQVTLMLRIAVTARSTGATHVFKHRVIVEL
jgi:hypothetical protein